MDVVHSFLGTDVKAGLLVILNLIVIESLLSVDNAAVLATMVLDLPKEQRSKALRYGIIGAYVLRGVSLLLAAQLIKFWWLKILGGIYLIYLAVSYFRNKASEKNAEKEIVDKNKSWFYRSTVGVFGVFWSTIALVELMDLAFSIDNVFAAVAFTNNMALIYTGVFIGILAMRFVTQIFVKLLERFSFLETIAFIVIGILGIKLSSSVYTHFDSGSDFAKMLGSEKADIFVSVFTIGIFIIPVISSLMFNFPKRHKTGTKFTEQADDVLDKR